MTRRLSFQTDAIELNATAGEDLVLEHGLGHEVNGWLVVWAEQPVALTPQPSDDPRNVLILRPNVSTALRLVLV